MCIFQTANAIIYDNPHLLRPQIEAYRAAFAHYSEFFGKEYRETLIVMPTGTGKTGVMAILPFGISKGRVLIITPGKIVRKTVFKDFDSIQNPENTFWYKRKVLLDRKQFPKTYLYQGFDPNKYGEKERTLEKLRSADIVITNIHKIVGSSEEINLKGLVAPDFFDMIIIDEAHHVAANMWRETLDYFNADKVIKLTATPFRSDRLEITNNPYDPIYEYTLGQAIEDKLVKDVVKEVEIPDELEFYNPETGEKYTLEEAKKILGNDWVSKSVAMSESCSKQVIKYTKEILEMKRKSYPYHQVLAITCNDKHAQLVTKWFEEEGLSCTYVSSHLSDFEIEQRLNDFANGIYDVMVSIQMLGEGYDNPNISVIALFRPFKTLSPYTQAIGRGLRRLRHDNLQAIDNYCNVIYHQELGLEKLWEYYKSQTSYAEQIRKQLETFSEQLSLFSYEELGFVEKPTPVKPSGSSTNEETISGPFGEVRTYKSSGIGKHDSLSKDGYQEYMKARYELISRLQLETEKEIEKIKNLREQGLITPEQEKVLIENIESKSQRQYDEQFNKYKDMVIAESMRKDFYTWMNTQIEEFFKRSSLTKEGYELYETENNIDNKPINNIGYIVKNFNQSMYNETKKSIGLYLPSDFAYAKKRFVEKLEYYLKQYGEKKEEDEK
jgi:superfamily II DNA or RNA helicase